MSTAIPNTQEIVTFPINISYPEALPLSLRLDFPAGRLNVEAGAETFITGEVICSHPGWEPKVLIQGGNVAIRQNKIEGDFGRWRHFKNDWALQLGTLQPFTFHANAGAGQAILALGGLPITSLFLDCGAGEMKANFSRVNPQKTDLIRLNCGAGHIQIDQLLNANTELIKVEIGAGQADINFTGEALTRDLQAKINVGVGQANVNVKRGIAVQVESESGQNFLSKFRVASPLRQVGPTLYQTPDFATTTDPKLTIRIQSGLGAVDVNSV